MKEYKFTEEYKNRLSSKIKEHKKYLQLKTGYGIKISVEFDKKVGYVYCLKVSLDSFNTYVTVIVDCLNRAKLLQELKLQIPRLDFMDKRRVSYSKSNISNSSTLWCCSCEEEKTASNFHRNVVSPRFSKRNGYNHICFECANAHAAEIYKHKNFHTAIVYLCGLYDRPYVKRLADEVSIMNMSPVELFGEYYRLSGLQQYLRKKDCAFYSSELFE